MALSLSEDMEPPVLPQPVGFWMVDPVTSAGGWQSFVKGDSPPFGTDNQIRGWKALLRECAGCPRRAGSSIRRDGRIEATQADGLWVAKQLGRPIVKAWSAIGSDSFARKELRNPNGPA